MHLDILFVVHGTTRRSHASTMQDYKLAKQIARYVKRMKNLKQHLREDSEHQSPIRIFSFSDADFAADNRDRKSVSAGAVYYWNYYSVALKGASCSGSVDSGSGVSRCGRRRT